MKTILVVAIVIGLIIGWMNKGDSGSHHGDDDVYFFGMFGDK